MGPPTAATRVPYLDKFCRPPDYMEGEGTPRRASVALAPLVGQASRLLHMHRSETLRLRGESVALARSETLRLRGENPWGRLPTCLDARAGLSIFPMRGRRGRLATCPTRELHHGSHTLVLS